MELTATSNMKTKLSLIFMLVAIVATGSDSQQLIPFQGCLTNQKGERYTEGRYTIIFNLYDAPVGGASLWRERHESIALIDGMVNVLLGSKVSLWGQDFTKTLYLGVTVDADGNENTADPEMVPRQMMIPCFFAKDSEKLLGADWSAILAVGSTDPRTGYVAGARLVDNAISSDKIEDGGVASDKIKDGSVMSAKIADGSVMPSHLSDSVLNDLASAFLPIGVIMPYAGSSSNIPIGWLPCDGRVVSSETYPRLFAAIGTTWGKGTAVEGSTATYFKLPDLRDRALWGSGDEVLGTYIEAGVPNVTGDVTGFTTHGLSHSGAFSANGSSADNLTGSGSTWYRQGFSFSAANSSSVYGSSDTVQPPAVAVNFVIKVDSAY